MRRDHSNPRSTSTNAFSGRRCCHSLPDNASLFHGPLYPSSETILENENEEEDNPFEEPQPPRSLKLALTCTDAGPAPSTKAQIKEGAVPDDPAANAISEPKESRSSGPDDRMLLAKMPIVGSSNVKANNCCPNEEVWRTEIQPFPSATTSQTEDSSQLQEARPAPIEPSLPGSFQQRPAWISPSPRVDEDAGDMTRDTSDPELSPQPNNNELAEATPVTLSIEMAEPVDANNVIAKEKSPRRRRRRYAVLVLAILIVGIFLVIGLIISPVGKKSNNMDSSVDSIGSIGTNGTTVKTWSWDLNFTVPTSTLAAIEHGMGTGNTSSTNPQFRAYQWMKADPYLSNYSSERLLQRFSMVIFFFATNGNNWKHRGGGTITLKDDKRGKLEYINVTSEEWLSFDHHECSWFSGAQVRRGQKACESDNATLQSLVLVDNELSGELPDELFLLTSLEAIELSRNDIVGTIPTHVSKLTKLWKLWLAENNIIGSLPSELGLLSNSLRWINTVENDMTGSLPSEIWQSSLWRLNVGSNGMQGFLPSDIGMRVPGLNVLRLSRGQFFGTLPTSMGLLEELEDLNVQNNQFTGFIPSELGSATSLTKC